MPTRILSEHRRHLGDFEVVDFVDEDKISSIRQRLDLDVPMDLHWTWEYASEVEELRNLYERSKKGQWNAEDDIDWSMPFDRGEWFLPREGALLMPSILTAINADEDKCREAAWDEFAHMMSQLLHGEQAAMQLCGQLTNACPGMDAKFYAGAQVMDEVRHVEALAKFLQRKMGVIHPISPTLKVLLDLLLQAPTWKLKCLGMQTLFEGMAVSIFDGVVKATSNPLLKDVLRRIQVDESRHAAFGILSMRQVVRDSSPAEMRGMEDFAFEILEALNANQQLDMLRLFGPKYGLDPDNTTLMAMASPEWPMFNSEIYMHTVVPNLMRLGLITERTEADYRRIGIVYGERFPSQHELPIAS